MRSLSTTLLYAVRSVKRRSPHPDPLQAAPDAEGEQK
jgi:hypothetical protein